ncbi:class I SAM-dependent methyltransferase [Streptomyces sp. NBRC 109706]|uniref:class I SAM-dependent methyltransferase n=1 Tax=Streptomyces sp. NBRC 109706 TaxID=1550035 RepID=UPI000783DDC8|nr:class I SAM-dependent methyltransferase [Streptomyces sp. NBRC 109706]
MNGPSTVLPAGAYWKRYYSDAFRFGLGTEHILATLNGLPPARRWADLGSGSETMLWAIALQADSLTAVDTDPRRLAILRAFTTAARPRGIHRTALQLCHRYRSEDFTARCRSLNATVRADCLTGHTPVHPDLPTGGFDLVTQFGLLGLCRSADHFTACFTALHRLLAPGGQAAGANWVRASPSDGRVTLDEQLYRRAAERAGLDLAELRQLPSADPDFPSLWLYTATRRTV